MEKLTDGYREQGQRKLLVKTLIEKGIQDEAVLNAIGKVPRHLFTFHSAFSARAYEDSALPIGDGQTISQPYTVAYQTQLLQLNKKDKVLEIGTGSGYQAAVLSLIALKVFSIERQKNLFQKAKPLLMNLGFTNIHCTYGDGFEGLPNFAPFDKILVTAAAPYTPDKLLSQLRMGGSLVIPVGEKISLMKRITKVSETNWKEEVFDSFTFVPMLKGKANGK